MKNICIVGYGAIGPVHAAAINKTENARLYAVCDIKEDRIRKCREEYDVIKYDDFEKALLDENIHSIHVCTPHHLHFEMIKKALAAGKDVVVEKPATRTKEEFDELLELRNSHKVCVVLQNRCNPCMQTLRKIVKSGEMGEVKALKGILTWNRDREYYSQDEWRGKEETEGGGVLINQAIHTLDYFGYAVCDVDTVRAQMTNFSVEEIEVEDTICAYLTLKNGIKGVFFATNAYGEDSNPEFEVLLEKGTLLYCGGKLYKNGAVIEEDSKPELGKSCWGQGHEALFRKYYDGGEYFSLQDVKNTMHTVFAIYESAKNGSVVKNVE